MDLWALAAGGIDLLSLPVYGYVAWRLYQRPVAESARVPAAEFSIWWAAVGLTALVDGVESLLLATGSLGFDLAYSAYLVELIVASLALWALVCYLAYIYSGKNWSVELGAFYAVFYVSILFYTVSGQPYAVADQAARPVLLYLTPVQGPLIGFVALALIVPEFVGAFLYLSLYRKTTDRTLRYRIGMVSAGIFLYFGFALLSPSGAGWTVAAAALDVVAAALTFLAYFPPRAIQERYRIAAVGVTAPTRWDDPTTA